MFTKYCKIINCKTNRKSFSSKVNTAPTSKDDKEYFEERWSQPTVDPKGREFPEQIDDDTKRIFRNLFGEGFPGFGRK